MAENKKTLTVTQQVKELVYDIQNKAYLTGQAREAAGKSYQVASNMQASDDDENSYQIRRSLANAFSSLKSLLGEYLNEDNTTSDNLMDEEIDNNGKLSFRASSNEFDSPNESLYSLSASVSSRSIFFKLLHMVFLLSHQKRSSMLYPHPS